MKKRKLLTRLVGLALAGAIGVMPVSAEALQDVAEDRAQTGTCEICGYPSARYMGDSTSDWLFTGKYEEHNGHSDPVYKQITYYNFYCPSCGSQYKMHKRTVELPFCSHTS